MPFAVKMPWSILRLLRLLWLIVSLRRKAKGQRRKVRGERSEVPDFLLSSFHLFRSALVQAAFAADSLSVKLKFKDQMAVPSASVTST